MQEVYRLLRCHRCGDQIGVYEPLLTLVNGRAYETSRIADPQAAASFSECYHRECFKAMLDRGDARE
jgi:hypothetical protein